MRYRVACTQGNKGYLFLAQHSNDFRNVRSHQHNVNAEGLVGQRFCLAHLVTCPFHSAAAAADDTGATGVGNSSSQHSVTRPRHTALDNRIFYT